MSACSSASPDPIRGNLHKSGLPCDDTLAHKVLIADVGQVGVRELLPSPRGVDEFAKCCLPLILPANKEGDFCARLFLVPGVRAKPRRNRRDAKRSVFKKFEVGLTIIKKRVFQWRDRDVEARRDSELVVLRYSEQ